MAKYIKKRAKGPMCGDCGTRLPGIASLRPKEYKQIAKIEENCSSRIWRYYVAQTVLSCAVIRAF